MYNTRLIRASIILRHYNDGELKIFSKITTIILRKYMNQTVFFFNFYINNEDPRKISIFEIMRQCLKFLTLVGKRTIVTELQKSFNRRQSNSLSLRLKLYVYRCTVSGSRYKTGSTAPARSRICTIRNRNIVPIPMVIYSDSSSNGHL